MSHRPIQQKKLKRLRKAINRTPLPAYVDLIDWLKLHSHADTTGQALKLMLDGKVRVDTHIVGRHRDVYLHKGEEIERWVPVPRIRANLASKLRVVK